MDSTQKTCVYTIRDYIWKQTLHLWIILLAKLKISDVYIYIYIYISSSGFLFLSCWRNPFLLSVQQCQSLPTLLKFEPIAWSRSSHQCLFGWHLGCFWSCGYHTFMCLVHLLSFSHETCPAHWYLLAWIWWLTSVIPVFEQIQLALFLSCSVSPIINCSSLHCVVTIFCSCDLLRDHVSLLCMITWSMHSLCTFIFNLSGMFLFCIMESSLPKPVHPRPILCLNSCSWLWSFVTICPR